VGGQKNEAPNLSRGGPQGLSVGINPRPQGEESKNKSRISGPAGNANPANSPPLRAEGARRTTQGKKNNGSRSKEGRRAISLVGTKGFGLSSLPRPGNKGLPIQTAKTKV